MSKCSAFGHQWSVIKKDDIHTLEICDGCGKKKRFCIKDNQEYYKQEHRADTMQQHNQGFNEIYPGVIEKFRREKLKEKINEQQVEDKLQEAAWEIRRQSLTSKFVH